MKALSMLQPYAGLLVLGIKQYETRSFNTKHRGPLAIHASKRWDPDGKKLWEDLKKNYPGSFGPGTNGEKICTTLGAVIGQVEIVATFSTNNNPPPELYLERTLGNYDPDRWFWECKTAWSYPEPFPAKGSLGLWKWEKPKMNTTDLKFRP